MKELITLDEVSDSADLRRKQLDSSTPHKISSSPIKPHIPSSPTTQINGSRQRHSSIIATQPHSHSIVEAQTIGASSDIIVDISSKVCSDAQKRSESSSPESVGQESSAPILAVDQHPTIMQCALDSPSGPLSGAFGDADEKYTRLDKPTGVERSWPVLVAILSVILFVGNGQLLQFLNKDNPKEGGIPIISHLLNLVLCHIGGLTFYPFLTDKAKLFRFCDTHIVEFWKATIGFAFLLMFYNWCWVAASQYLRLSALNALFQLNVALCGIYEYCRAAPTSKSTTGLEGAHRDPKHAILDPEGKAKYDEARSPLKVTGIVLCILGTAFVGMGPAGNAGYEINDVPISYPHKPEQLAKLEEAIGPQSTIINGIQPGDSWVMGTFLGILAAFGYAGYQCTISIRFASEKAKNPAAFCGEFGFAISAVHLCIILPVVFLVGIPTKYGNPLYLEELHYPTNNMDIMMVCCSAMIAFIVNVCWIYVLYCGADPSMLSVTMSLSIPLAVVMDGFIHHVKPGPLEVIGQVMIFLSFTVLCLRATRMPEIDYDEEIGGRRGTTAYSSMRGETTNRLKAAE